MGVPYSVVSAAGSARDEGGADDGERLGVRATADVRVPSFSAAIAAVRDTRLIALVPRRFAQRHRGASLRIAEAPAEIDGITYAMLWHPRLDDDKAHRWLRGLIERVVAASV